MEKHYRFLYFTKTHESYGLTIHITKLKAYPEALKNNPVYSVVGFPDDRSLDDYVKSAKDAGLHVCMCDES